MSARLFLDVLFSGCDDGLVELRAVPSARRTWTRPGVWDPLGPFITAEVRHRQDVYVGIATRRDASAGTAANLAQTSVVWVDHDTPIEDARPQLDGFPFPPALIVRSGFGTHRYWKLREPLDLRELVGLARLASLLRRLAAYLGGDDRATDPARVLRLPSTYNHKYESPKQVTVAHTAPTTLDPSELEAFLPREVVRQNTMTIGSSIPVGTRNDQLYGLTRSLRARGLAFAVIAAAVRSVNQTCCEKPLTEGEIQRLLHYALLQPNRSDFIPYPVRPVVLHDRVRS